MIINVRKLVRKTMHIKKETKSHKTILSASRVFLTDEQGNTENYLSEQANINYFREHLKLGTSLEVILGTLNKGAQVNF